MTGLKFLMASAICSGAGIFATQAVPEIDPAYFESWERVGIVGILIAMLTVSLFGLWKSLTFAKVELLDALKKCSESNQAVCDAVQKCHDKQNQMK